jgi:hypothetical protein
MLSLSILAKYHLTICYAGLIQPPRQLSKMSVSNPPTKNFYPPAICNPVRIWVTSGGLQPMGGKE